MEQGTYRHTADMGEISGFGGGYEECCQDMLEAGVKWLLEHPTANLRVLEMRGVFGIVKEDSPDTEELSKVVIAAMKGEGTGAMHHAVMARLLFINENGWETYCAKSREHMSKERVQQNQ